MVPISISAERKGKTGLVLLAAAAADLARSACLSGQKPFTLDWFTDEDTKLSSEACYAVGNEDGSGFDHRRILQALEHLLHTQQGPLEMIYGSGLDCRPDILDLIPPGIRLLGNPPEILRKIKHPQQWHRLLNDLDIPYPETIFESPADSTDWLFKPACGEGGSGIHHAATFKPEKNTGGYYQKRVSGLPCSILFIASEGQAFIVGMNTQWQDDTIQNQPFRFGGIINRAPENQSWSHIMMTYIRRICAELNLSGLNTLDFIIHDNTVQLLELNPRPGASFTLYDRDYPGGLLLHHRLSCLHQGFPSRKPAGQVRAMQIIYAHCDIRLPDVLKWPAWCAHCPKPGSVIRRHAPVCTVRASGSNSGATIEQLYRRVARVCQQLRVRPPTFNTLNSIIPGLITG